MSEEKKCCYHDPDEECACECHKKTINWEERYNKAVEYFKTAKFVAIDSLPRTRANGKVHDYSAKAGYINTEPK